MPETHPFLSDCFSWGGAMLASNLAMTVFGFGDQIKILRKTKDSTSVSLRKYVLLLLSLVVCLAHLAFEKPDVFFVVPATFQLVYATIIAAQIVYYRQYPGGRQPAMPRLAA